MIDMIQVGINVNYISAERFWESGKKMPPGIHISTNINVLNVGRAGERLRVPFVTTINYSPSFGQMSLKGEAILSGGKDELKKIEDSYKSKQAPPPQLIQSIAKASIVEATIISKSLRLPPPIPFPVPKGKKPDEKGPDYVG